jgi:heterodisulfide reductase subunit D
LLGEQMKPINIILYLCSWGPHAAFQTLQDRRISIPPEIKMVRIPCTGRISKSLLFKPFEVGADGVLLVGCNPGTCRYGGGARIAREHSEDARKLLDLIGLGGERIRHETFLPDADDALLALMENFTARIRELGPTPILPGRRKEKAPIERTAVDAIIARYDAHACQDCGKCTSACPLALSGKNYSPRGIVRSLIGGEIASEAVQQDIWSCLTCGICYQRCPSAVDFPSFIQEIRHVLLEGGEDGHKAHSGVFQSLMRAMTHADIPVKHWDWLPEDIQTDPSGPILFFGGCAPYFDVFFKSYLGARTKMILEDSLRLLNFFDIKPAILSGERCCGHDLLWTGDRENFLALAKLNVDAIAATGAEELVTTCPECYRTFHHDYPANGIEVPFKVSHMYDLLEREIGKGSVGFKKLNRRISFQDPCRLSRYENLVDLPRNLIARLKTDGFLEMDDRGAGSICCGNSGWSMCDAYSKNLQVRRLRQAKETGADLLVTACPKCQIHLKCAMEDMFLKDEIEMEMLDLTSVIARTIYWK